MTSTAKNESASALNVPNLITGVRLVLSLVVFMLIPLHQYLWALVIFVIAASTDWIDGYWARRFDQVTQLGRVLDPLVDKIIICGTFILLAVEMDGMRNGIHGWMAVLVVGRELLVTVLRSTIEGAGGDFSAKMAGKLKMVFQCVAVGAALVVLMYGDTPVPGWIQWTLLVSVWLAILSTIHSGVGYVFAAVNVMRQKP